VFKFTVCFDTRAYPITVCGSALGKGAATWLMVSGRIGLPQHLGQKLRQQLYCERQTACSAHQAAAVRAQLQFFGKVLKLMLIMARLLRPEQRQHPATYADSVKPPWTAAELIFVFMSIYSGVRTLCIFQRTACLWRWFAIYKAHCTQHVLVAVIP